MSRRIGLCSRYRLIKPFVFCLFAALLFIVSVAEPLGASEPATTETLHESGIRSAQLSDASGEKDSDTKKSAKKSHRIPLIDITKEVVKAVFVPLFLIFTIMWFIFCFISLVIIAALDLITFFQMGLTVPYFKMIAHQSECILNFLAAFFRVYPFTIPRRLKPLNSLRQ